MRRVIALLLPLLALTLSVDPSKAEAENVIASLRYGSDRLGLFSASEYFKRTGDQSALPLIDARMERLGFPGLTGEKRAIRVHTKWYLLPVLEYDPNINGGTTDKPFTLGGLVFYPDPSIVAVAGWAAGAAAGAEVRYVYGEGRYLSIAPRAKATRLLGDDFSKLSYGVDVCSNNHLRKWTFLDVCAGVEGQRVELGSGTRKQASVGVTQLVSSRFADHEIRATLRNTWYSNYDQSSAELRVMSAFGENYLNTLEVQVGEHVDGHLHMDYALSLSNRFTAFGRKAGVWASISSYSGGSFFGTDREDDYYQVGGEIEIVKDLSVGLNLSRARSTVDAFSEDSANVFVNYTAFEF